MSLFVATHHHPAEACPTSASPAFDVLSHVSAATAAGYGVTILAEAVPDGEHGLILILQAAHQEQVDRFMAFFTRFGSVQVRPAWSSEATIARGGCTGSGHENEPAHLEGRDPAADLRGTG
jgi:hypothetical protein